MKDKIFSWLIVFFILFSLLPTFYELKNRDKVPPERSFELIHNYYTDYNFYLSRIRQGLEGHATVTEKYTSEPHQGSFIQVFYLWLGWVGRWVGVPWERPGDVYHIARVVFGIALLAAVAEFCKRSFAKSAEVGMAFPASPPSLSPSATTVKSATGVALLGKARLPAPLSYLFFSLFTFNFSLIAFLLAVTASTWPIVVKVTDGWPASNAWQSLAGWRLGGYMPWWSVMDSLQRITFVPHLLAGQTLIVFLLTALSDREVLKKGGNWIFLGILGFVLGMVFPPGLIFVYTAAAFLVFLELVAFSKDKILSPAWLVRSPIPRIVFGLISAPSLLYLSLMLNFYPWKRLVEYDILNPVSFSYLEYAKAVGPVLVFGLVGGILALVKKEQEMLAAVAGTMAWISLFIIFKFIPQQSALRFSEMMPQVPLAILTAYLFYQLQSDIRNLISSRKSDSFISLILNTIALIPILIIVMGLGVMYSSWFWQRDFVNHKLRSSWPLVPFGAYVMYPLKDFASAINFLQSTTPRNSVVLSLKTAGNYIPALAGNTVYLGQANTIKFEEKEIIVKTFFAGQMDPEKAREWLVGSGISFIFFGPQEKEVGPLIELALIYPFLKEVYRTNYVTVYQVSP